MEQSRKSQVSLILADDKTLKKLNRAPCAFRHRLGEVAGLDDDGLAGIIERAAVVGPSCYNLGLVEEGADEGPRWVQGLLSEGEATGRLDGHRVLDMIRSGRLWLQIEQLALIAPRVYKLVRQAYDELTQRRKGFSYHRLYTNLLISGPGAKVLPHIDSAEVILWHFRGRKCMCLYDPERFPVPAQTIESIVLREQMEDIDWPAEWYNRGEAIVVEPGMALSFPYLWPHSVENLGELNVSIQTEYHHPRSMRRYGALFANGLARRRLGLNPKGTGPGVVGEAIRASLGLFAKGLRLNRVRERRIVARFVIDPRAPEHIRRLPAGREMVLAK